MDQLAPYDQRRDAARVPGLMPQNVNGAIGFRCSGSSDQDAFPDKNNFFKNLGPHHQALAKAKTGQLSGFSYRRLLPSPQGLVVTDQAMNDIGKVENK